MNETSCSVEETANGINHGEPVDEVSGISLSKKSVKQDKATTVQSQSSARKLAIVEVSSASTGKGKTKQTKGNNTIKKATQKLSVKEPPKEVRHGVSKEGEIKTDKKKKKKKKKKGGKKATGRKSAS